VLRGRDPHPPVVPSSRGCGRAAGAVRCGGARACQARWREGGKPASARCGGAGCGRGSRCGCSSAGARRPGVRGCGRPAVPGTRPPSLRKCQRCGMGTPRQPLPGENLGGVLSAGPPSVGCRAPRLGWVLRGCWRPGRYPRSRLGAAGLLVAGPVPPEPSGCCGAAGGRAGTPGAIARARSLRKGRGRGAVCGQPGERGSAWPCTLHRRRLSIAARRASWRFWVTSARRSAR